MLNKGKLQDDFLLDSRVKFTGWKMKMKINLNRSRVLIPSFFLLIACTSRPEIPLAKEEPEQTQILPSKQQVCWTGMVNNQTPVFLHYAFLDKIMVGEITYLNTKEKKPIKVIGTVEADTSFTLLEFEPDGNNTGIITGKQQAQSFQGSWFSPETNNEKSISLVKKDTVLNESDLQADMEQIGGEYHYQFSPQGSQGYLKINQLPDNQIAFSIYAVTEAPARQIAQIPTDTITITGNSFRYLLSESDSCELAVTFYNGFATVDYTNGLCPGQFGENATVDGVFLKVK